LGGENILSSGGVTFTELKRVPRAFYDSMPRGHLQPFDVLINKDGAQTGKVGIYKGEFDEACVNEHLFILRNREGAVDQRFLYYSLLLPETQLAIATRITGSAQPGLNSGFVDAVEIGLPPESGLQSRIAEILSTVDEAIEGTEKLIAKHQQIKAGLMHDLFTRGLTPDGHLRPPHSECPSLYKDSPLGPIPKEWGISPLRELTAKIADRDHTTPRYVEDGVLMVSPTNLVDDEHIEFASCQRIPESDHRINSKKTDIRADDLILHRIGAGLGAVRLVTADMPEFSILHSMAQIRPLASRVCSEFLLWAFRCPPVQSQMGLGTQSIGVPDLGLDKIAALQFAVPRLAEQSMIAERLRTQGAVGDRERERLRKLTGIKKGLMHDLLTGEVPVPIPKAEQA